MGSIFYQGSGIKILGKKGLRDQNNGKKVGINGSRIYHATTLLVFASKSPTVQKECPTGLGRGDHPLESVSLKFCLPIFQSENQLPPVIT